MTLPPRPPAALGHPEALGSTIRVAALVLAALCCLSCARAHNRTGCGSWIPGPDSTVCCEKCHPGNRPVKKCGKDPKELCRPCTQGTYILSPADHICTMCTQCIGLQVEKEPCTGSRDTVCGCRDGYRCGDAQCSYCFEECGKGYEPTEEYTCHRCPDGTFNDKIHQKCIPWRKSCPLPEQHIVANGTAEMDSVCKTLTKEVMSSPRGSSDKMSYALVMVAVAVACFCLGLLPSCFLMGKLYLSKRTPATTPEKTQTESLSTAGDSLSCRFGQPEQEQGGSTGSISSDDSRKTLLLV